MFTGFAETVTRTCTGSPTTLLNHSVSITLRALDNLFDALYYRRGAKHYACAVHSYDAFAAYSTKREAGVTGGDTDLVGLKPLLSYNSASVIIVLRTHNTRSI
jgi:hypothetical protein